MGWSNSDSPYRLIEVDGPEANTKETLRPSGLNHSVGSVVRSSVWLRSAKGTGLPLSIASLSVQC